jgi:UDP-N-acetyl-D-glucosamine dehydrogenase
MPHHVVKKIAETLNADRKAVNGARILVLGVAYKRDIDDVRESPGLDVMKLLREKGADIGYSDPHVPFLTAEQWNGPHALESLTLDREALETCDCAVIITDHRAFDYEFIADHCQNIVDTRNALQGTGASHVTRLGAPMELRSPSTAAA